MRGRCFFLFTKNFNCLAVKGLYYIIFPMSTHNVDYYINLWDKFERLKEGNRARQRNRSYINPQSHLINPIADFATDLIFKTSRGAYLSTGKSLVWVTKPIDAKFAHKIQDAWQDPISTETMLKIGRWIQSTACLNAVRRPTSVPFFHFFDRALIAFTQHTYVVASDLIALLDLPKNLHNYLDTETVEPPQTEETEKIDPPTTLPGKTWQYVKMGVGKVIDALFALIELMVKATRVPLQRVPVVEKVLGNARTMVANVRARAYAYLVNKAHDFIHYGEKRARHKVTAHAASVTYRHTIRFAIGTGLQIAVAASAYYLANYAFTQYTGAHEFPPEMVKNASRVMKVVGGYLWVRCVTPTLRDLYEDYKENFKPGSSTFLEVSNILSTKNIAPLVTLAKKKLGVK